MNKIVEDIINSLEEFKDSNRLEFARKSYPTAMRVIGVTNPNSKIILNELKSLTKHFSGREKIDLANKLCETEIFECQHIALEYLGKDKKALSELLKEDVVNLMTNMDNWVSVDCYAGYILGYAWREGIVSTNHIKQIYNSKNFWFRRIALVSTVALNQKARGGKGDAPRTLEICKLAINDHHDMINKAMSWVLRELAKVDKEPVRLFLEEFREQLNKRVIREVTKKLETGRKN